MNVFIFSSLSASKGLCNKISNLIGENKGIGYIPSGWLSSKHLYADRTYMKMGFRFGIACPLGANYDEARVDRLLQMAAIHIDGGNTFELMFMLHIRGMVDKLREYVRNGGILMGNSAGGIVMSESISIAKFADDNYLGITGKFLDGLGLVDFDMKPHWDYWSKHPQMFQDFAKKSGRKLYCLREGQVIHVDDKGTHFHGGTPKVYYP